MTTGRCKHYRFLAIISISSITTTCSSGSDTCPEDMHKVYLVIWPGSDYHWYRKDVPYDRWSHKPGGTAATDRDGSGQFIFNPETADTGPYTVHCGYMCACGDCAEIE